MLQIDVSTSEFLRRSLNASVKTEYLALMVLVARSADASTLQNDLVENWESLDDLTHDQMLIVCPRPRKARAKATILAGDGSTRRAYVNSSLSLAAGHLDTGLDDEDIDMDALIKQHGHLNPRAPSREEQAAAMNAAASETAAFFGLGESMLPCLVTVCLRERQVFAVHLPTAFSLYQFTRSLLIRCEPSIIALRAIESQQNEVQRLLASLRWEYNQAVQRRLVFRSSRIQQWTAERERITHHLKNISQTANECAPIADVLVEWLDGTESLSQEEADASGRRLLGMLGEASYRDRFPETTIKGIRRRLMHAINARASVADQGRDRADRRDEQDRFTREKEEHLTGLRNEIEEARRTESALSHEKQEQLERCQLSRHIPDLMASEGFTKVVNGITSVPTLKDWALHSYRLAAPEPARPSPGGGQTLSGERSKAILARTAGSNEVITMVDWEFEREPADDAFEMAVTQFSRRPELYAKFETALTTVATNQFEFLKLCRLLDAYKPDDNAAWDSVFAWTGASGDTAISIASKLNNTAYGLALTLILAAHYKAKLPVNAWARKYSDYLLQSAGGNLTALAERLKRFFSFNADHPNFRDAIRYDAERADQRLPLVAALRAVFPEPSPKDPPLSPEAFEGRYRPGGFQHAAEWYGRLSRILGQVCRIVELRPAADPIACGTGFLVAPDLILTNSHVTRNLPGLKRYPNFPEAFACQFGYDGASPGSLVTVPLATSPTDAAPGIVVESEPTKLDYALLRLATPIGNERGFVSLAPQLDRRVRQQGNPVLLFQHPGGDILSVSAGITTGMSADFVDYDANTLSGSSGSPVYTWDLQLVGLHQRDVIAANRAIRAAAIYAEIAAHLPKAAG